MALKLEYKGETVYHPSFYINELVERSGLTQEDFAKRLGTTPKNLSILLKGEQSLSIDIATNLSRMLGTTIKHWLDIQQKYDELKARIKSDEETEKEKEIFEHIDYNYFVKNFNLFDLSKARTGIINSYGNEEASGSTTTKIKRLREFLKVSSLKVFEDIDFITKSWNCEGKLEKEDIIKANVLMQIALNEAAKSKCEKFDKKKFEKAIGYAHLLMKMKPGFMKDLKEAFLDSGVVLVYMPDLSIKNIKCGSKKIGGKVVLMICDTNFLPDEMENVMEGKFAITIK